MSLETNKNSHTLIVDRIKSGIVIDHMPPGTSLRVLSVLLTSTGKSSHIDNIVALAMNVRSDFRKERRKDVLKIADFDITDEYRDKLGLVIPGATLNIIKETKVMNKEQLKIPQKIKGIFCPANNCITNGREDVTRSFKVINEESKTLRCDFCDQSFSIDEYWNTLTKSLQI
ncbi:MAG: aspartate carbamoyltransferase regulatory subunit [Candidatus Hodarchaeales archaeon]|jgi:aspartate carbamoyltransferase regulatory subunit